MTKLNEELGEIVCPECKGEGTILKGVYGHIVCEKCQGQGKLDWCQQAVGVAPNRYFQFDSSASMSFSNCTVASTPNGEENKFHDFYMNMIDEMANKIVKDVDRQILRSFEEGLEHNENRVIIDKRRKIGYDHRVFSEFMLLPST